jgi:hypothetical protein
VANPQRSGRSAAARLDAGFVVVCALVGAVVAFPAAWIWLTVADPPSGPFSKTGITLGETQLNQQSEVTLWFLVVGFFVGLLAGAAVGWFGRRRGVVAVIGALVLCGVAAGLTAYLGISVFGPDERAEGASAKIGESIRSELTVGTDAAYLSWPIGGLIGTCVVILFWPDSVEESINPAEGSTNRAQGPAIPAEGPAEGSVIPAEGSVIPAEGSVNPAQGSTTS